MATANSVTSKVVTLHSPAVLECVCHCDLSVTISAGLTCRWRPVGADHLVLMFAPQPLAKVGTFIASNLASRFCICSDLTTSFHQPGLSQRFDLFLSKQLIHPSTLGAGKGLGSGGHASTTKCGILFVGLLRPVSTL